MTANARKTTLRRRICSYCEFATDTPARSSLSYANRHRLWQLYEQVFYRLLERVRGSVTSKPKFRFQNKLVSLDSPCVRLT